MKKSPTVLKAGTRPSNLALTQNRGALDRIENLLDGIRFDLVHILSVGDGDRTTDLRASPADFFTRELDEALLRGEIDLAVHSAKDLPDPLPAGIDSFWLPWREEPRDVLVLAPGRKIADLPDNPVIGVSSERREEYCRKRFPNGIQQTIRGNIEERIEQVDRGDFDMVVMAAAALIRLNIEERITDWIKLDQLQVPAGQGYLAITYRAGDERIEAIRNRIAGLGGRRILLTCSEALQNKAANCVRNHGGIPVSFPLIQLQVRKSVQLNCAKYDRLVVTSPSAVRAFMELAGEQPLPKIMVCGRGTADAFEKYGITVDTQPESGFSAASLKMLAKETLKPGETVLRVRSDKAGTDLADALRQTGTEVEDVVIYDNVRIEHAELPEFDATFFASASGVESFIEQWRAEALDGKTVVVIGMPTKQAMEKQGRTPDVVAPEATVAGAMESLAEFYTGEK